MAIGSPHAPWRRSAWAMLVAGALVTACASDRLRHESSDLDRAQAAHARQEYAAAVQLLRPLALKGDRDAQYALGYMHYYGQGTPRDPERALAWFEEASLRGSSKARKALELLAGRPPLPQTPPATKRIIEESSEGPAADAATSPDTQLAPVNPRVAQVAPPPQPSPVAPPAPVAHERPAAAPKFMRVNLGAPPKRPRYTIQLLGSRSKRDLAALVRENGLDPAKTYYLAGEHKGARWYRLLYGGYVTPSAARAALAALPAPLMNHKPWVRPIPAAMVRRSP